MSYKRAVHILPEGLLEKLQEYVDGEFIYIPKKSGHKKGWGSTTVIRQEFDERNTQIYKDYMAGKNPQELSDKYFLSLKSIQRIIRNQKIFN